jgi:hypothetical protein
MRLFRFKCSGCGLEMALPDRPEKCFCCESTDIIREGWRMRISRNNRKE